MAYVVACGAECGIVTAGNAAATNRHWTVTGSPAVDTSIVRTGARSYRFAGAATRPVLARTCASSQTVGYFRGYFYVANDWTPTGTNLVYFDLAAGTDFVFRMSGDTVKFTGGPTSALVDTTITPPVGAWCGVEMQINCAANPTRMRWRVWTQNAGWQDQSDITLAQAATSITTIQFGEPAAGPTSSYTVYFDDVLIGEGTVDLADYSTTVPKHGKNIRLRPTADGSHSFSTSGDFKKDNTTNVTQAATDLYQWVDDDDQTSIADFISQNAAFSAGNEKMIEFLFADEAGESRPNAVGVTATFHAAGTGADEVHLRVSDDGSNFTNVVGDWNATGLDVSDTSAHFVHKVVSAPPSGGSWTLEKVNSMRAQCGHSDDVNAVPFYDSVSLEVDWITTSLPLLHRQRGRIIR